MTLTPPRHADEACRVFDPDTTSARAARQWCTPLLERWGAGARQPDAVLVLSELIANAIRHGDGAVEVRLHRRPGELRIEVSDEGPADPVVLRRPDAASPTGRGLGIIEHVAADWGVRPRQEGGKTVWASLPVDSES